MSVPSVEDALCALVASDLEFHEEHGVFFPGAEGAEVAHGDVLDFAQRLAQLGGKSVVLNARGANIAGDSHVGMRLKGHGQQFSSLRTATASKEARKHGLKDRRACNQSCLGTTSPPCQLS